MNMNKLILLAILMPTFFNVCAQKNVADSKNNNAMRYNQLTPEEERVILHKATERPFTGELLHNKASGVYVCKRCNAPLYRSEDKFDSHCGWPSFDDEIENAVKRVADADGRRTEILCGNCGGHLGHVFLGEGFTPKQTRHCVNSVSLKFVPARSDNWQKAYFASGCFWGTEYFFMKAKRVKNTAVGFLYIYIPLLDTIHSSIYFVNSKVYNRAPLSLTTPHDSLLPQFFPDPTQ